MSRLKTITITISDESAAFLADLYTRLTTQSNRHTADPYYFTVRKDVLVPAFDGCGDVEMYSASDGMLFDGLLDRSELVEYAEEMNIEIDDFIIQHCDSHWMTKEERYQGVYFTEKACEDFIKHKRHHISGKNINSYVEYAQHNPEFLAIKNLLKEIGAQVVDK